eukprot:12420310-Karenia_brevis.AAC.1
MSQPSGCGNLPETLRTRITNGVGSGEIGRATKGAGPTGTMPADTTNTPNGANMADVATNG